MRARGILAEGDALFDDSALNAIPLLEQVSDAAPKFAPAWELLATARSWVLRSGRNKQPYEKGRDGVVHAANEALRLDQGRGGAYSALAMLQPWGAYSEREQLLEKALRVAPRDAAALTDMATFCWSVGRFRDGLDFAERACEINPLMPSARLNVAQMRAYVGDYERSIAMHRELHRQWPANPGILLSLVNTAAALGFWEEYDEAVKDNDRLTGWQRRDMRAACAYAQALRNKDPALVERRVSRYVELLDNTGTLPLNLVVSIAGLGCIEEALDLAERSSYDFVFHPDGARPSAYFPGTILGPWSHVLREPRFMQLCARLGLCKYWIDSGNWPDSAEWVDYDFQAEAAKSLEPAR